MHILHMIDTLQIGGAQKLLGMFIREALPRGIRTSVVCLNACSAMIPALDLQNQGVPVAYFPAPHLLDLQRIDQVKRFLQAGDYDLVQTHLTYANILGGLCGRLAGLPVVATLHSAGSDPRYDNRLRDWIETLALRSATRVVAASNRVAAVHRGRIRGKPIRVIPNSVPLPEPLSQEDRQSMRKMLNGDPHQTVLISVSRFSPQKGLDDLVMAFAWVRQASPNVFLVLVGDGDQRQRVEGLVASLGLGQSVLLTGRRSDVDAWLQASDLYVSASHLEGLPVSVLEAMAAGLPVVVTAAGDLGEIVTPQLGRLTSPRQPQELAEAILGLLGQPEEMQKMGRAAQAYVAAHYNQAAWFDSLLDLYFSIPGMHRNQPATAGVAG